MESCTRIFSSTPRERWERWKEVTQIITRWKKNTWWSRSNNCPLKYDHFDPLPQVWKNGVKSVRFIHKRTEVLWFICSLDRSGTTGKGSQVLKIPVVGFTLSFGVKIQKEYYLEMKLFGMCVLFVICVTSCDVWIMLFTRSCPTSCAIVLEARHGWMVLWNTEV